MEHYSYSLSTKAILNTSRDLITRTELLCLARSPPPRMRRGEDQRPGSVRTPAPEAGDTPDPLQVSVLTVMPCRLLPLVLALAQAVHRAEGDVPRCEGGHTGPRPFCFPADYNKVGVAARLECYY